MFFSDEMCGSCYTFSPSSKCGVIGMSVGECISYCMCFMCMLLHVLYKLYEILHVTETRNSNVI